MGRTTRHRRTRGQALVEFALVIPLFLLVLCGVLDFGFMLYSRMTIINASREGARIAIQTADHSQIPAIVPSQVRTVSSGLTTSSPAMTVTATCVAIKTPGACDFSAPDHSQPGDAVVVTVNYQYHSLFPLMFGQVINLTSSVQMVLE